MGATVSILLGTLWGQAVGFVSHRTDRRVLAWTILSLSLIFAAALVQRAPAAVAVLTLLTALLGGFGLWLLADGAQSTGLIYFVTPSSTSRRWGRRAIGGSPRGSWVPEFRSFGVQGLRS